jgi:hypothetical protein
LGLRLLFFVVPVDYPGFFGVDLSLEKNLLLLVALRLRDLVDESSHGFQK